MSGTNIGGQQVYYNYQKALTGDIVNKASQGVKQVGVLSGLGVTKINNTSVSIASGIFNISDGTHTVTISKASANTLTVSNANNYIVIRYTYSEVDEWYATFLTVSSPASNDVILAYLNWTGTTLTSVDLSVLTDGNRVLDTEVYVTANGYNRYFKDLIISGYFGNAASGNLWLNLIGNSWFSDSDTPPLEEMLGGVLPVLGFDSVNTRYLYFMLKSGASVDVNFKLKYTIDSTSNSTMVLKVEYITLTDGLDNLDSLTFSNSTSETIPAIGTINRLKEYTTTTLKIPSSAMTVPDKLIICRLTRDTANVSDTNTGTLKMIEIVPVTS